MHYMPLLAQEELAQLKVGDVVERIPPRPGQRSGERGQRPDPFEGTWEILTTDEEGKPFLDRHDVWGWVPTPGARPADNLKGFNFVPQQPQQPSQQSSSQGQQPQQ